MYCDYLHFIKIQKQQTEVNNIVYMSFLFCFFFSFQIFCSEKRMVWGRSCDACIVFLYKQSYESTKQKYYCLCNIFRNHWTATGFRCIQLNSVQEIRRSGARDHLPSTAPRAMATCVFQAKISMNSQSFVTLNIKYQLRKVVILTCKIWDYKKFKNVPFIY